MSLIDSLKKIDPDDAVDVAARALDTIGTLARSSKATHAADVLTVIAHIYQAIVDVTEERITTEDARVEFQKILAGIGANDAAADAALDDKFDKG